MYTKEDFCRDIQRFSTSKEIIEYIEEAYSFCKPFMMNTQLAALPIPTFIKPELYAKPFDWKAILVILSIFGGLMVFITFCMSWKKLRHFFATVKKLFYGFVNQPSQELPTLEVQEAQDTRTRAINPTNSNINQNPEVITPSNLRDVPLEVLMDYIERENPSSRISSQNDSNPEHVLPSYDEVLALEEEPPSYKEAVNSGCRKSFWQTIIFKKKAKK